MYKASTVWKKGKRVCINNGYNLPAVGLGTWQMKKEETAELVEYAIDVGYRLIDCAHAFQNEAEVGDGIAAKIMDGTVKREELFISSKLWNTHHSPELVEPALMVTLKNLGLEYLDLYLMHWPIAFQESDDLFPIVNGRIQYADIDVVTTWAAIEKLYSKGLVKCIGVSNFNLEQLERLVMYSDIMPATNQVECHPMLAQLEMDKYCDANSITLSAHSPLGSGNPNVLENPLICDIALKYNKTVAQILIKYSVQRGFIVTPKSVIKGNIYDNINIFDFEISKADMDYLTSLDCNFRTCLFSKIKYYKHYPFRQISKGPPKDLV